MIACNRFFKIIWLTLGIYLLTVNIVLWATEPSINLNLIRVGNSYLFNISSDKIYLANNFQEMHAISSMNYKGFRWFFDRISTFPGPLVTHGMMMTYANILSGYSITGNWGIDFLLAIFRILSTPLLFVTTISMDIINNVIWFFSFFVVS